MPVDAILDSGQSYSGRAFRDCMRGARDHHIRLVTAHPGMRWSSGDGVVLSVLAPGRPLLADTGDDVNENSIVAMLHYRRPDGREFRALFTGDAGQNREAQLLAAGFDLRADVLKVGHHGSKYASTSGFVAAVAPRLASISVGRHNTFGHPSAETLATLQRAGARVYRTDRCGALKLDVDAGIATSMLLCLARDGAKRSVARDGIRVGTLGVYRYRVVPFPASPGLEDGRFCIQLPEDDVSLSILKAIKSLCRTD